MCGALCLAESSHTKHLAHLLYTCQCSCSNAMHVFCQIMTQMYLLRPQRSRPEPNRARLWAALQCRTSSCSSWASSDLLGTSARQSLILGSDQRGRA